MFRHFLSLSLALFPLAAAAQDGFRWVVEPRFADAGVAHQGVVPLFDGQAWGLMGRDGQWVLAPQFEAVGGAGQGRFAVQRGGLWGAVDIAGREVLPFEFQAIGTPSDITPVKWQGAWYALDPQGQPQEALLNIDELVGNDGFCVTGRLRGEAVADWRGAEPRATSAGDGAFGVPVGGVAVVELGGRFGYLECQYGTISGGEAVFDEARPFVEEMGAVRQGETWAYVGPWGNSLEIAGDWTGAREFSEGLAPVKDRTSGLWGYIDRQGQWVIAPQFDAAYSFSDGLAGVNLGGKRGFLAPDGSFAVAPQFVDFTRAGGGVAAVKTETGWGVVAAEAADPATMLNLPLADLMAAQAGRDPGYALVPSNPHWYFAQDVVSLHAITFSTDGRVMITTLANREEAEVALWDATSHRLIRKLKLPGATQALLLPGTEILAVGTETGHLVLIDAVTGAELHRIRPHDGPVKDMVLSPDGRFLAVTDGVDPALWSLPDGALHARLGLPGEKLRFAPDSGSILVGSSRGDLGRATPGGEILSQIAGAPPPEEPPMMSGPVPNMALSPEGTLVVAGIRSEEQPDGFYKMRTFLTITREEEAPQVLDLPDSLTDVLTLDLSDDGRRVAYAGNSDEDWTVKVEVRDLGTGEAVASESLNAQDPGDGIARSMFAVDRLAFVPGSGDVILVGAEGDAIVRFDPAQGRITAAFGEPLAEAKGAAAPPGGGLYLSSDGDGSVWVWDMEAGALEARVEVPAIGPEEMAWSDGGTLYLADALDEGDIIAVDFDTLEVRTATGEEAERASQGFADYGAPPPADLAEAIEALPGAGQAVTLRGGAMAVQSETVGLHRAYDLKTGALLAEFLATPDGEWLVLTPEGFFAASPNGARLVSVANGLTAFSVDQVYQALYRPDLVRAKLAGDPGGEVAKAAAELDLAAILKTGPAPLTRFALPMEGTEAETPEIEVEAEITDEGGGIGRIEWRVNGLTVAVQEGARGAAALESDVPKARARVALEPGANLIEVVAYNAAGLLASVPASLTVNWDGVATDVAPDLYVLSVGVNDYADGRLKLNYAAADAKAFAEAMGKAGQGLFGKVEVVTLLDAQVTGAGLDAAFADMAAKVRPQDVFVFFLAGHGKTVEGRYYFIPQDFRFDGEDAITRLGIDQDRWQGWAAAIRAKKSVMIYDTCESGSLTGTRSVDAAAAQSAAVARLTRAMGRTILSASTDDAPALEGYRGHGVLTFALLDALGRADDNGNATIEVTELAGYLDRTVPEISQAAFGLRQVPQMSIRGSDFALGASVAVLSAEESFPTTLTHVALPGAALLDGPGGAPVGAIPEGAMLGVYRIEERDGYARIAKDGRAMGWVAVGSLMALQ